MESMPLQELSLYVLPSVIADRSNGVISSGSGDGITSLIHFGRPGFSGVLM